MTPLLLPSDPYHRSIREQLNNTINQAQALYASVCFWSIRPDFLDSRLVTLLSQPGSFCIADIHSPTNVDKINLFHQLGTTNFHLFFKELRPYRSDAFLERHLMHTKLLLFDLPDGKAELWVGSHNFTRQALEGVNREASLVIPCHQQDALYTQTLEYLRSILTDNDCHPFDPNLLDTYKKLQGLPEEEKETGVYLLPLAWNSTEWGSPATLAHQLILLVGHKPEERRQFATISDDTPLAIRAHDLHTGQIRYFSASLIGVNDIDPQDQGTYNIVLSERHLAVRRDTQLPFVAPREQQHAQSTLRQFRYWVSIRILDELPSDLQFEDNAVPPEAKWQTDSDINWLLTQIEMREVPRESASYFTETATPIRSGTLVTDSSTARVSRWLERARQRRYRTAPAEPKALHAVFSASQAIIALPQSLADLDQQFQTTNLPTLQANYEAPLRASYYQNTDQLLSFAYSAQGPQVKKLLQRYRLR